MTSLGFCQLGNKPEVAPLTANGAFTDFNRTKWSVELSQTHLKWFIIFYFVTLVDCDADSANPTI